MLSTIVVWVETFASPGDLENLLSEIRAVAKVSTRTTIVLSTPYENRPPAL